MADDFPLSPPAPNASDHHTRSHSDLCENLCLITLSTHLRHRGIWTLYSRRRRALHSLGRCQYLWPSFPLLSHFCRLGPQLDLHGKVQGCSGNVLRGLNLEYAPGYGNSLLATPADLGTSSFAVEEVWALWNLFSGQLVSFSIAITILNKKDISCARANECGWDRRTCIASLLRITSIGDMKHEDFPCMILRSLNFTFIFSLCFTTDLTFPFFF